MAKIDNGYLGGFSGTLGTAIGYNWNGRWCLRSMPAHVRNPRTELQQAHRMMFREEVRLAARMSWAVNAALRDAARAGGMTSYNLFVKLNQGAFGWADGALQVDWGRLQLSMGPVAPVALTEASVDEHNVLSVSFEKNPLRVAAKAFDEVHLYVYCPSSGRGVMAAPVYRRSGRVGLMLPDGFAASELKLYAMVSDERREWSATATAEWCAAVPEACAGLGVAPVAGAPSVGDDVVGREDDGLDGAHEGRVVGGADADVVVGPPLHASGKMRVEG